MPKARLNKRKTVKQKARKHAALPRRRAPIGIDPFEAFSEWSRRPDEKAYGKL
jgi:hypothetical protein